jgi:predicted neuraminidase
MWTTQVWRADSMDGGKTWTKPYRTSLPNNNSGLDVAKLPSGTLVLAYNPTTENRFPLQVAISEDNGATWSVGWNVETEGGDVKEVRGPAEHFG